MSTRKVNEGAAAVCGFAADELDRIREQIDALVARACGVIDAAARPDHESRWDPHGVDGGRWHRQVAGGLENQGDGFVTLADFADHFRELAGAGEPARSHETG